MRIGRIGRRYARAALDTAIERGDVERVRKELRELATMWDSHRELRGAFENPGVALDTRLDVAKEICAAASFSPIVAQLFCVLVDRGRSKFIPEVAAAYADLAEAHEGRMVARVTTATPLPESYFSELRAALEKATGKRITIEHQSDPSLIAGAVTQLGDRVIDGSLRARLAALEAALASN